MPATAQHAKGARIFLAYRELSRGIATQFDISDDQGENDTTTIGDDSDSMAVDGIDKGSVKISGFYERSTTVPFDTLLEAGMTSRTVASKFGKGALMGYPAEFVRGFAHNKDLAVSTRALLMLSAEVHAEGGVKRGVCVAPYRALTIYHVSTAYAVGQVVLPATDNGHYYVVSAVSGDALSGVSNPTWPTSGGATVVSNHVTFQEAGSTIYDRGASAPTSGNFTGLIIVSQTAGANLHVALLGSSTIGGTYTEFAAADTANPVVAFVSGIVAIPRYVRMVVTENSGALVSASIVAAIANN